MRRASGTAASYRIAQNMANYQGKSKAEIAFNSYQLSRGLGLVWGKRLPFWDSQNGLEWTFECDFLNPTDEGGFDVDFEIDGMKFHQKQSKEEWKDRLKNAQGIKVIHIPAELAMRKKFWPYLDEMIPKALVSKLGSVLIPA